MINPRGRFACALFAGNEEKLGDLRLGLIFFRIWYLFLSNSFPPINFFAARSICSHGSPLAFLAAVSVGSREAQARSERHEGAGGREARH